jgi:hypothetical protein
VVRGWLLVVALAIAMPVSGQSPPAGSGVALYRYFIGSGTPSSRFRTGDRQLAQWALDAWRRTAEGAFQLEASSEQDAVLRVYWADADDGQYGEMRVFDVNGRRGAAVYIRPDTNALGPAIAARAARDPLFRDTVVYLTCLHELGHAFGLSHTSNFDDVMYFFGYGVGDVVDYFGRYRTRIRSREDIARTSGFSENDVRRLQGLYITPSK